MLDQATPTCIKEQLYVHRRHEQQAPDHSADRSSPIDATTIGPKGSPTNIFKEPHQVGLLFICSCLLADIAV